MSSRLVAVFTPFENLTDPRVERTRAHDLFELVVVALCGTIAGSDSWVDIERFGNERLAWLRTFLKLEEGIPSHDTFGRVFARLDPAQLAACIQQWFDDLGRELGQHIAIDGKTLRGSGDKAAGKNPLHLVSAWASEARLTLGQIAVDSKSNEITAIPLLLELLDLKGATVTIDAMGCQKEIAAKIVARGGDWPSKTIIPPCMRRSPKSLRRLLKKISRRPKCGSTRRPKSVAAAKNAASMRLCQPPSRCLALPIGSAWRPW